MDICKRCCRKRYKQPLDGFSSSIANRLPTFKFPINFMTQDPKTYYIHYISVLIFSLPIIISAIWAGTVIEHLPGAISIIPKTADWAETPDGDIYDSLDLSQSEDGSIFIATHISTYPEQRRMDETGIQVMCAGNQSPCKSSADCVTGGLIRPAGLIVPGRVKCNEELNQCDVAAWCTMLPFYCPHLKEAFQLELACTLSCLTDCETFYIATMTADEYPHLVNTAKLNRIQDWEIYLDISMSWPTLNQFMAYSRKEYKEGFSLLKVSEILEQIKVSYDDVKDTGALIAISVNYQCWFVFNAEGLKFWKPRYFKRKKWRKTTDTKCGNAEWFFERLDAGRGYSMKRRYYTPKHNLYPKDATGINKIRMPEARQIEELKGLWITIKATAYLSYFHPIQAVLFVGSLVGSLGCLELIAKYHTLYFAEKSDYYKEMLDMKAHEIDEKNTQSIENAFARLMPRQMSLLYLYQQSKTNKN